MYWVLFFIGIQNLVVGSIDAIKDPDIYTVLWMMSAYFSFTWAILFYIHKDKLKKEIKNE